MTEKLNSGDSKALQANPESVQGIPAEANVEANVVGLYCVFCGHPLERDHDQFHRTQPNLISQAQGPIKCEGCHAGGNYESWFNDAGKLVVVISGERPCPDYLTLQKEGAP